MFFRSWLENVKSLCCFHSQKHMHRRRRIRKRASINYCPAQVEVMEERQLLSAGALDPTFGTGGQVTTNFPGPTQVNPAALVVTQPDGKAIVVGNSHTAAGNQMEAVRYNTDGSVDSSFGTAGVAVFHFHGSDHAAAAALDSAGRLVVVGSTLDFLNGNTIEGNDDFAVTRLNTDGSVDTAFGNSGVATANFGPGFNYNGAAADATSMAIDSVGRIVVAGDVSSPIRSGFALARFNSDGSLDTTFGSGGTTTLGFGIYTHNVRVDPTGRILVDGFTNDPITPGNLTFGVARLLQDGTPDANFGTGGKETVHLSPGILNFDYPDAMAVDPSGRIILAGSFDVSGPSFSHIVHFTAARLNAADGSLDGSFGAGGVQTISFGGTDFVEDVKVDAAGQILLAGGTTLYNSGPYHNNYTYSKFAVARLNGADGSLDAGFGSGGESTFDAGAFSGATNLALDPAGRIILVGHGGDPINAVPFSTYPVIARMTAAGVLDSSFATTGFERITNVPGPTNDFAAGLVVSQPDGKSLVVGTSLPSSFAGSLDGSLALLRYNADGSLDTSFGSGGKLTFAPASGLNLLPASVTVDPSGRIVIAGNFPSNPFSGAPGAGGILRLSSNDSVDTSFGVGGLVTGISARAVKVDAVGRIVLAVGNSVMRLNSDGSADTSFGSLGTAAISFSSGTNYFSATSGLAFDAAGRIVVVGTTSAGLPPGGNQFGIVRLNTDGSVDTIFGTGGATSFNSGNSNNLARAVAIDSAGRIDVAGNIFDKNDPSVGAEYDLGVIQLNANGTLNSGFGNGGKTIVSLWPGYSTSAPVSIAVDAVGRIALASSTNEFYWLAPRYSVDVLKSDGCPDADFFTAGQLTSSSAYGTYNTVAGAAFDSSGRLIVASTATVDYQSYGLPGQVDDFVLTRYLAHDPVVEAGSATFAADLQAQVTALQTFPPLATPRVVIHADNPAEMPAVTAALAGLSANPAGPTVEVLLDLEAGTYTLGPVSVPAGLRLILDGDGGTSCAGTFASNSTTPALAVVSGDVLIRDGAVFTGTGNVPAILVQRGRLVVRNSTITETTSSGQAALAITGGQVDLGSSWDDTGNNTIAVNGTGVLIRLTGPNNVMALGNTFQVNGQALNNYQIEDAIDHSLDGLGGGTVFWVPNNVFVSAKSGNIQLGVNAVPVAGTVNVQTGVQGSNYYVGNKLLTIAFDVGLSITQQADSLDATKLALVVTDANSQYFGTTFNSVKFTPGLNPGEVQVKINKLPNGTFLPTGRLIAHAGYGDTIDVDSALFLPAWLYGGGNGILKGGSGNNVLISVYSGDLLVGGAGRSLLIGDAGAKLQSTGGQDILIAGYTLFSSNEVALAAIMAEWTSTDSLATRIANLSGDTANPLFSASRQNGNYFLINSGPNQTVFNDLTVDTVSAAGSLDWIFASSIDKLSGVNRNTVLFTYGP